MNASAPSQSVSPPELMPRLKAGLQNTLRASLLIAALVLFVGFSLFAIVQPLRPDPYQGGEFLSLNWWLHPYERNANSRLPAIEADPNAIYALPDASRVWVAGTRGLAAYSTDGGGTWIQQKVGEIDNPVTTDMAGVFFADAQKGWLLSVFTSIHVQNLYQTTDGGDSWNATSADIGNEAFKTGVFLGTSDTSGSICFAPAGGDWYVPYGETEVRNVSIKSPTISNYVQTAETLYAVFCSSVTSGWVAGTNGTVFKTTDSGKTWQTQRTNSDQVIRSIYFLEDGEHGWVAGQNGALEYTEDGGDTWTTQASHTNTMLKAIYFLPGGKRGWAAGTSGTLLHTEDGGKHWVHQTRELSAPLATTNQPEPRHFLPPWYAVSLLVPGLLGFLALRPQRTEIVEEQTVADIFISDRPLEPGDADPMNFHAVALGLSRFLRNEKTLPPLTIAITGEWGTGKSSLMNLLRADLRKYGFQPVWFNAWHHQKEEHLLASLLQNIRLQAIPAWWRSEGFIFRVRLLGIRGWRRLLPLLVILIFIAALTGYVINQPIWEHLSKFDFTPFIPENGKWLELAGKVGAPLTLIGTIITGLRRGLTAFGVKPASLMSSGSAKLRVGDLEAQTSFRQKFAIEFQDVTRALNPRTMIIFIDDLDRCRPENVLEVLEAVNFLLSSGDCFVVMGMARERVERCVGLGFKDVAEEMVDDQPGLQSASTEVNKGRSKRSEFAKQYLDKLINIEVPVPAPTVDEFRRLLVPGATPAVPSYRWLTSMVTLVKKLWPALVIGSFLFMGFWAGKTLPQPSSQAATPPATNSNAPAVANVASPVETRPGNRNTSTSRRLTRPTTPAPTLPAQPLAEFTGSQHPSNMPVYWMAILAFLLVMGGGLWILMRPLDSIVKDSPGFVQALEIWHPLVAAKRKTPRSLKRFTNRVRYLAMRQRSPKEGSSLVQRFDDAINRRLRRKERTAPAPATPPLIPEASLVALCVVDDFSPNLVRTDVLWNQLSNSSGLAATSFEMEGMQELQQAIEGHRITFPEGWPTHEHRHIYLKITAGLRVN
jgi:photosystem II stability/assembly factor-like uncharacterized protein